MKASKVIFLAAVIGAAGCGSKGGGSYTPTAVKTPTVTPVATGEDKSLFPVAVGNQWTYESLTEALVDGKQQSVKQSITMEIKSVEPNGNGQKIALEIREDDVVKTTQTWLIDDTGVYQASVRSQDKDLVFTPPQCVLKFPVKLDDEWQHDGTGPTALGATSSIKAKSVNKGPQLVDTRAGQVSAYRIETESNLKGTATDAAGKTVPLEGAMSSVAFFAPKVGMVRLIQTVRGRAGAEKISLQLQQSTIK